MWETELDWTPGKEAHCFVRNMEASSLQGLANIEDGQTSVRLSHCSPPGLSSQDTIEKIENMTPEEADVAWMWSCRPRVADCWR